MHIYLAFIVPTANTCDGDSIANAVANADYSSCVDGETSGSICTPTCDSGYYASTGASGFLLTCDGSGDFDSAGSTLACIGRCMYKLHLWLYRQ
jgi:hypothetical protein